MSKHFITNPSDPRVFRIIKSSQILSTISEVAKIEIMQDLTDTKFKGNIPLNNSIRLLKQYADSIGTNVSQYAKVKDRDSFTYEYSIQMHRLISHFAFLSTEQIESFMDGVEKVTKELNK